VVLSAYSGLTVVPSWYLASRVYGRFHGLEGIQLMADSGRYMLAGMSLLLFVWCSAHVVLPLPALAASLGIRLRRPWGRDLGMALGLLLLIMIPIGTIIGIFTIVSLVRGAEEFEPELA
jgi:hypothetical protein